MSHHKPAELTIPNTSKMVLVSLQLKPLFITLNKDTTVPTLHLVSTTLKYIIAETCGGLQVSENSETESSTQARPTKLSNASVLPLQTLKILTYPV